MRVEQEALSTGEPTSLSLNSKAVADIMWEANDLKDGDNVRTHKHTHTHMSFEVLSDGYISMKCLNQHERDYSYWNTETL